MKKNILILTSSFPYGKGEGFLEAELHYLEDLYNIYLIPTYPRGKLREKFNEKSIEYSDLPLFRFRFFYSFLFFCITNPFLFFKLINNSRANTIAKFFRNIILLPKAVYLADIIKNKNIFFIYAHWLSAPAQLALYIHLITKIPFGITGHRWDLINENNFSAKFKYAKFIRLISENSRNLLNNKIHEKYKNKIHIIYMGVSIENKSRISFNQKIETNITKTILCIANLIPVKGHKYLIDAIYILKNKGIIVNLDLIGTGELEHDLKKQIKNLQLEKQINFIGFVKHNIILKLLSQNKYYLYCQPSLDLGKGLHEGIPVSLMEAMSYGIPCISTKTGSISELINNNINGILVDDKKALDLAEAIEKLIKSPLSRDILAKEAINTIDTKFNINKNCNILRNLFSYLI